MRLNLGCGFDHRDGYVNVDFLAMHHPDVQADVLALPFGSDSIDEIFGQDVLEHLPRTSTDDVLAEWARTLAPGGRLRLRLPSLFHATDVMRASNDVAVHRLLLQNLYGTQAYTGDVHLTSFTNLTLATALHQVGLREVIGEVVDGWMFDVVATKRQGPQIAVFWEDGFHYPEGDGDSRFRWAQSTAVVNIVNTESSPRSARFSTLPVADHDPVGGVRVHAGDRDLTVAFREPIDVRFTLRPGVTSVRLSSQNHRLAADPDPRVLHFQCMRPELTLENPIRIESADLHVH